MAATPMPATPEKQLGSYLRDRRARLDPASFGLAGAGPGSSRRRTPGLRREEVAQRANISPTWYTWLEQGRGGAPSADVLDRISRALMLTDIEREHLYLIGLGRPPEVRYRAPEPVTPRLQRLIDALEVSPALVKTMTWDVVAWNRAAALVLTDYGALPPERRNVLRLIFGHQQVRDAQYDWDAVARFVVGAFRADVSRAGAGAEVAALVEELSATSPAFAAMWADHDVRTHGDGVKHLRHPVIGPLALEYSAFSIDGRPDLSMVIYNPASDADAARIRGLVAGEGRAAAHDVAAE